LATFLSEKKGSTFLLVKTKQLSILDDFFKYANHINRILKKKYLDRAKDEIKIIETYSKNSSSEKNQLVKTLLSIDRFVVLVEKGANVLMIQHPTIPYKVSPLIFQILLISGVLGGMIGVFFTFIRNAIRKRKEQLAKA